MWYFAWCLGIGFAVLLAVVVAVWGDYQDRQDSVCEPEEDRLHH